MMSIPFQIAEFRKSLHEELDRRGLQLVTAEVGRYNDKPLWLVTWLADNRVHTVHFVIKSGELFEEGLVFKMAHAYEERSRVGKDAE